ncbi:hypothetical protein [Flavobacterium sp.]|uniref:hypothetical protein n=1 Tax=Flavobacterium sp. TaxID=239 RepID=UPI00260C13A9|nr:hypothetical protein [Flavobacterium sp.]
MKKELLIIGFGWLGQNYALANKLHFERIIGIKRSAALRYQLDAKTNVYALDLFSDNLSNSISEILKSASHIIIALPPSSAKIPEDYLILLEKLKTTILSIGIKTIFISSIGAGSLFQSEGKILLEQSEIVFLENSLFKVLRFGGLIGTDRHPVLSLARSNSAINGADLVNLISIEDCCGTIDFLFNNFSSLPKLLTAVSPYHPAKVEYYNKSSAEYKVPHPHYYFDSEERTAYQLVNKVEDFGYTWINEKLKRPND